MTAPEERAGCEHAGPGYWGWWCRDCHSMSTAPDERAALAAHREACGVCGHDCLCWQALEMIEATHARRLEEVERDNARLAEAELAWEDKYDGLCREHEDQRRRLEEARAALDLIVAMHDTHTPAHRIAQEVLARLSPPPPRGE